MGKYTSFALLKETSYHHMLFNLGLVEFPAKSEYVGPHLRLHTSRIYPLCQLHMQLDVRDIHKSFPSEWEF
jgi:hypothetical protein